MAFRRSQDLTIRSSIARIPNSHIPQRIRKREAGISLWTDRAKSFIQSVDPFVVRAAVFGEVVIPVSDPDGKSPVCINPQSESLVCR